MGSVVAERNGLRLTLRARDLRGDRTLVEVAALVGIRQDELSRIERGETASMRFDTLLRLCEAYQVPPGELLGLEIDTVGTSPLESVLRAVAVGTAVPHRPPRHRGRVESHDPLDDSQRAQAIAERDIPEKRLRRRAPSTVGTK